MRKPKGYVLLITALFVLVGSIGVSVFLHTCEEDGTFVSYFVPANDEGHCENAHQEKPACCDSEESTEDDDCCGDEIKYIKFKLDYFQKISAPFIPVFHVSLPVTVDLETWSDENRVTNNYANPPPLPANILRSLNQVWII